MTTAQHYAILARCLDSQPGHAVTVPRESLRAIMDAEIRAEVLLARCEIEREAEKRA